MNIPCAVVRDLLPLYAEDLTSEESADLVREHLETCAGCREQLAALRQPKEEAPQDPAPMKRLKKELRKRRRRTAAIAALGVFLILFAVLAHVMEEKPLSYSPELLSVEGAVPYDPAAESALSTSVNHYQPEGWQTAEPGQVLIIHRNDRVSGAANEFYLDEESGEVTVYIQYFRAQAALAADDGGLSMKFFEGGVMQDAFYPVPDRVIYGFGRQQTLLWGEPMNGGVQILPRLALAYYALIAAGLAVLLGALWLVFRRKPSGRVFRQLCFAPAAYLLGQLCIKGGKTESIFLLRDIGFICIEAAAFYLLLTLTFQAWSQHRRDQME